MMRASEVACIASGLKDRENTQIFVEWHRILASRREELYERKESIERGWLGGDRGAGPGVWNQRLQQRTESQ
jgi:hypothetical protein